MVIRYDAERFYNQATPPDWRSYVRAGLEPPDDWNVYTYVVFEFHHVHPPPGRSNVKAKIT